MSKLTLYGDNPRESIWVMMSQSILAMEKQLIYSIIITILLLASYFVDNGGQ